MVEEIHAPVLAERADRRAALEVQASDGALQLDGHIEGEESLRPRACVRERVRTIEKERKKGRVCERESTCCPIKRVAPTDVTYLCA